MNHHLRAQTLHSSIKITVPSSSLIQTILSAPESHRIMPLGPRALPPVGNRTLPWRFRFFYHNTLYIICKAKVWKWQTPSLSGTRKSLSGTFPHCLSILDLLQYSSRTSVRLGAWFWSAKLTYSYQNHCASSRSVYLSRRLDSHWDKFAITHHLKRWESSRLR